MGMTNNMPYDDEDILVIEEAEREGARLVIALCGLSGSGKTRTAIELAWGLANFNSKKVGFLDAENRRGRLYADVLKNDQGHVQKFMIANLDAPFSPARYKRAILEFQRSGVEVLVIDSGSHEWEGIGGCHDIAAPPGHSSSKPKKWNLAKEQHKLFVNTLLQSDMHIIVCLRAREKVEMVKGLNPETGRDGLVYNKLGVLPIQEGNFMYEMTASMMMWDEGKTQQVLKCPGDLRNVLGRQQGYITAADGKAVRDWVDGAQQLDPEVERNRNMLRTSTEAGMASLQKAWMSLTPDQRRAISQDGRCPADLKASAVEFDAQRAAAMDVDPGVDDLNAKLGAQAETAGATDMAAA